MWDCSISGHCALLVAASHPPGFKLSQVAMAAHAGFMHGAGMEEVCSERCGIQQLKG